MTVPKDVIKEIKDIITQEESLHSGQKESYVFVINNRWDYSQNSINVIDKRIEDNLEYLKSRVQQNKPIYFTCIHELIDDINCLESLKNSIKKYNLTTAKICQATISEGECLANPLVNFFMWRGLVTRKNISWDDSEKNLQRVFRKKDYFIGKRINPHRKYKSICSIRKENRWRTSLMKRMDIDNSIIRYAKWPDNADNKFTNTLWEKYVKNFPTMQELIKEYEQCYFSFIIESCNNEEGTIAQLSEKTIIGLITGTMPIIFGDNNLIKDMTKAGFYTWNDYFGYKGDKLKQSQEKIEHYYDVVKKVKKLSLKETKEIYKNNLDKIQKNYDIISELLFLKITEKHII